MHSHIVLQHGKDSQSLTSMELRSNTQRSRISELEGSLEMAQENTHALRKQTLLLQEKMSNASRELEEKNNECLQLASKVASTDNKLYEAERRVEALATLQSHRWMEFSKMADNMKDLSQNMLAQSKSNTRKAPTKARTIGWLLSGRHRRFRQRMRLVHNFTCVFSNRFDRFLARN